MPMLFDKFKSRTGASITYALLLFLVCAVVGSVVLTAATSASGRMSNTTQVDQRYYCVTSAGELLCDLIEDKTIVIEKKTDEEITTTWTEGHGESTVGPADVSVILKHGIGEADSIQIDGDYSCSNLLDEASIVMSGAKEGVDLTSRTLKLTPSDDDALSAAVKETIDKATNRLTFEITDQQENKGNDHYTMRLVFSADISSNISESDSGRETPKWNGETSHTHTTTETTKLVWSLVSLAIV